MATNLYGTSCTPNLGGVSDHYTKSEVNQLLAAKAGTATTYTRTYLDGVLSSVNSSIASLSVSQVTGATLAVELSGLQSEIESDVAATYATLADTYTRSEVDSIISSIDLDPNTLLRKEPTTTAQNTINPGANNAIALTIRGSSTNPIVSEWRDSTSDRIGYVTNAGRVVFEGRMDLGRLVSDGQIALDMHDRRIGNLANPVLGSDAVPFSYLQSYILEFYEDVIRPQPDTYYNLDAGLY